jgi:ArsR family transcriptional regulator
MAKKNTLKNSNKKITAFLKAIAHSTRMNIVQLLMQEEKMTVSAICEKLNLEQSLTSHHLAGMRNSGVLESKRSGKNIYYMLASERIKDLLQLSADILEEQKK